jgi:hypothetical protein
MKTVSRFSIFFVLSFALFSCTTDTEAQNYYFKAFFLGDTTFVAKGEVLYCPR